MTNIINLATETKQDTILNTINNIGFLKNKEIFDTAGTYKWTAPEGVNTVYVTAIGGAGGGGGGGGAGVRRANSYYMPGLGGSGGGGNVGEFVKLFPIDVIPGKTYTVTVGAGGQGGIGGQGASGINDSNVHGQSGGNGGNGGNTSFHDILTVRGGNGGGAGTNGGGTLAGSSAHASGGGAGVAAASMIPTFLGSIFNALDLKPGAGTRGINGSSLNTNNIDTEAPGGTGASESIFGTSSGNGGNGGRSVWGINVDASMYFGGNGTNGTDGKLILRW